MHRARTLGDGLSLALALMTIVACSGRGDDAGREMPIASVHLIATDTALGRVVSPEGDAFGFAGAMDLRFLHDSLLVLENGNGRIVVFGPDWRPARAFGHEGAGPGELAGAISMDVWRDRIAVSEINNVRVSIFRSDGTFLRSVSVPTGYTQVAYAPDGTLFVNAMDEKDYLLAVDSTGLKRPFGERPRDLYSQEERERPRASVVATELFVVDPKGYVHVYDKRIGALVRFHPSGRRTGVAYLPADLRDKLRQRDELTRRDFGGSGAGAVPGATDLTLTDTGQLLLLFPGVDGEFGLLIDPGTLHATELRWAPVEWGLTPGKSGGTGVIHRGVLYRAIGDEVTASALQPAER